ncbi:hypothetical protein Tco_0587321, partial [Tanacetum coccineum]
MVSRLSPTPRTGAEVTLAIAVVAIVAVITGGGGIGDLTIEVTSSSAADVLS